MNRRRGGLAKGRTQDRASRPDNAAREKAPGAEKVDDLRPSSAPATSRARGGAQQSTRGSAGRQGHRGGASAVYAPSPSRVPFTTKSRALRLEVRGPEKCHSALSSALQHITRKRAHQWAAYSSYKRRKRMMLIQIDKRTRPLSVLSNTLDA